MQNGALAALLPETIYKLALAKSKVARTLLGRLQASHLKRQAPDVGVEEGRGGRHALERTKAKHATGVGW